MSEKLKEFLDVPQQFVRDGNQVCHLSGSRRKQSLTGCIVPDSLHKALAKRYAVQPLPPSQSFKCSFQSSSRFAERSPLVLLSWDSLATLSNSSTSQCKYHTSLVSYVLVSILLSETTYLCAYINIHVPYHTDLMATVGVHSLPLAHVPCLVSRAFDPLYLALSFHQQEPLLPPSALASWCNVAHPVCSAGQ
jgi:hypothetical protein